jgi:lambda family phage portal protein
MGWLGSLLGGKREQAPRVKLVRAKYDAASDGPDNRKHWSAADHLSADAAMTPEVRRTLRSRARYEVANNSYARGIVSTLANDVVGTGPRLQLRGPDAAVNASVEDAFEQWSSAVGLADKLRVMRMARAESGEAFALLSRNDALPGPIKLDIRLVEADQVANPYHYASGGSAVDGVEYDEFGNPTGYWVLRTHPGAMAAVSFEADLVPAANVLHYYRPDRPGQHRGIPDITPALPLFAQLRRYTLAVIQAAETAANFAGVLHTDSPAGGEAEAVEPLDSIELERNAILTLPGGWRLGQVDAKQPTTTYSEFKREILNEIARCVNMPFNIAACNSSTYNYASGRLDHQTYYRAIRLDQAQLATTVLDRVLRAWMREAILVAGLIPPGLRAAMESVQHEWFWPGSEHVDPLKEANAAFVRLQTNTTTLAAEYARQGKDWEAEVRQRARELALMTELGLTDVNAEQAPEPDETEDQ